MTKTTFPKEAESKLLDIQGQATDAIDAAAAATRRIDALSGRLRDCSDPKELAGIEQEITRLRGTREQANRRRAEHAGVAAQIEHWLRGLSPAVMLEVVRTPAPKLTKNETTSHALQRFRDEIGRTRAHLESVRRASPPKKDLKAAVAARVQQMAERRQPRVTINAGELRINFTDPKAYGFNPEHVAAMLAWLDPDKLIEKLSAEIDRLPEPSLALSDADKAKRTASLTRELEQLEREEEAIVMRLIAEGVDVQRRPNASPPAILGVKTRPKTAKEREQEARVAVSKEAAA